MTRTGARQADLEDPDDAVVADRISKVVLNLGATPPPAPPCSTHLRARDGGNREQREAPGSVGRRADAVA